MLLGQSVPSVPQSAWLRVAVRALGEDVADVLGFVQGPSPLRLVTGVAGVPGHVAARMAQAAILVGASVIERERVGRCIEGLALPAKGRPCPSCGRVAILALRPVVILRRLVTVRAFVLRLSCALVTVVTPHFRVLPLEGDGVLLCRI